MLNKKIEQLRKNIAENRIDDVIIELSKLIKSNDKINELIIHSANYNEIKKQIRLGIVSSEKSSTEKNRVTKNLLDLISELEDNKSINQLSNTTPSFVINNSIINDVEVIYEGCCYINDLNRNIISPIIIEDKNFITSIFNIRRRRKYLLRLFYGQNNQSNFNRWIKYLENKNKYEIEDELIKKQILELVATLKKLSMIIYEKSMTISKYKAIIMMDAPLNLVLMPFYYNHYLSKTKRYLISYLEELQVINDEIGIRVENIKAIK